MNRAVSKRRERFTFIALCLYAVCVFMFDADESKIKFIYATYGLLCLALFFNSRRLVMFKTSAFLVAYWAFSAFSVLWADDFGTAFVRIRGVTLLIIMYVLLTSYFSYNKNALQILIAIVIGAFALTAYMFYQYGYSSIISAIRYEGARLGDLINNVNAIGNAISLGIIAVLGVAIFYKKRLLHLVAVPMLMALLVSGSRTATISLLAGVFALGLCLLQNKKSVSRRTWQVLIITAVISGVWIAVRNLPATRELALRIESAFSVFTGGKTNLKEVSAITRKEYIELGWQQFLKSPIVGNGIGCAGYAIMEKYGYLTYLHNNYIEMLVAGGIVGFVLFYAPYAVILDSLWKRIFKERNSEPLLFIAFCLLIAKLVGHFGTVVYYSKIEYLLLAFWTAVVYCSSEDKGIAHD